MSDIVVKAYGFIPLKKKPYILIQIGVFVLIAILLIATFIPGWMAGSRAEDAFNNLVINLTFLRILILIALIGEAIETITMLAKFREKERAEKTEKVEK